MLNTCNHSGGIKSIFVVRIRLSTGSEKSFRVFLAYQLRDNFHPETPHPSLVTMPTSYVPKKKL